MIYITSSASSKDKIKDAICELVQLGFRNIEIGGGTNFYKGITKDLLTLQKRFRINFLVHNYFPPPEKPFVMNIASGDRSVREKTFELINKAVGLTRKLGNDLYTLHAGYNKSLLYEKNGTFYEEIDSKKNQDGDSLRGDFYKAIDFLLKHIIKKELRIAIENLFHISDNVYSFLVSQDDIIEFLSLYKKEPNIGLLLDLGHLEISSTRLGFDKFDTIERIFSKYLDKLFEIHISENNGKKDSHDILNSKSWQFEFLSKNKKVLKGMPVVFEWRKVCNSRAYNRFEELKRLLGS